MATVKIICRKSNTNKNGLAPLRIKIYHQGKQVERKIEGALVNPNHWNDRKQFIQGNPTLNLLLRQELNKYEERIIKYIKSGAPFTAKDILNGKVRHLRKVNNEFENNSLVKDFIQEVMIDKSGYTYETKSNYKTLKSALNEFDPNATLESINGMYLERFKEHLLNSGFGRGKRKGKKRGPYVVRCRCKGLKATINKAFEFGIIDKPDWRGFKIPAVPIVQKYPLYKEDLEKLTNYYYKTTLKELDKNILAAFLFTCYSSGMRFADIFTLRYTSFNWSYSPSSKEKELMLDLVLRKNTKRINHALNAKSKLFIDLSKIGSNERVFKLSKYDYDGKSNEDIARAISSANAYVNTRLKLIAQKVSLEKRLNFHLSRASFISNALFLGIDHYTICELSAVSLKVLIKHYADCHPDNKREAMTKFDLL